MKIIIIIYFTIGILSIVLGPIANRINRDIQDLMLRLSLEASAGIKTASPGRILLFKWTFRLLIVLFYPFFYIILLIDSLRSKKKGKSETNVIDDKNLYFFNCGGAGVLKCGDCGFSRNTHSFLHGLDDGEGTVACFQCQQCGAFHEIENSIMVPEGKKCDCGGELSGNKPLFCTKCKGRKMSYKMRFIT